VKLTPDHARGSTAGAELFRVVAAAGLADEIGRLIEAARQHVAQAANETLTTLYWQIGTRIRQDVLKERRAEYGAEIVSALGRHLEARFGRGFNEKSLRHMLRFAEAFPDAKIVAALRRQLSWMLLQEVRARHMGELVQACRMGTITTKDTGKHRAGRVFAPKSIRNLYSTVASGSLVSVSSCPRRRNCRVTSTPSSAATSSTICAEKLHSRTTELCSRPDAEPAAVAFLLGWLDVATLYRKYFHPQKRHADRFVEAINKLSKLGT
jgi:hypothetical protein